jgi:hypothetical protein
MNEFVQDGVLNIARGRCVFAYNYLAFVYIMLSAWDGTVGLWRAFGAFGFRWWWASRNSFRGIAIHDIKPHFFDP